MTSGVRGEMKQITPCKKKEKERGEDAEEEEHGRRIETHKALGE